MPYRAGSRVCEYMYAPPPFPPSELLGNSDMYLAANWRGRSNRGDGATHTVRFREKERICTLHYLFLVITAGACGRRERGTRRG